MREIGDGAFLPQDSWGRGFSEQGHLVRGVLRKKSPVPNFYTLNYFLPFESSLFKDLIYTHQFYA